LHSPFRKVFSWHGPPFRKKDLSFHSLVEKLKITKLQGKKTGRLSCRTSTDSFIKDILYYVLDTVAGNDVIAVNKTDQITALKEFQFYWRHRK